MKKVLKISMPVLLILGLLSAAGCAAEAPFPAPVPGMPPSEEQAAAPGIMKGSTDADGYRTGAGDSNETGIDRKIVKTGHVTLEVDDIGESIDDISAVASELGGYVVSSDKRENKDRVSGSITIRVPAERFDEAFDKLRQLAVDVPYESTDSRDVTEEYTDLKAQLHNLEATEAQYLALLEKADTVKDIITVQKELSNVRREIERIKGRMQYLERTSDMSLIQVSLQETKSLTESGWSASETFKSAVRGLIAFGKVLANIAIWLVIFCWIWIPILVFVLRRRRRKAKQLAEGSK